MSKRPRFLFVLLHACPSTLFLYGEPFYARARFAWSDDRIALSQALSALSIAVGAVVGGKITERFGALCAVRTGLAGSLVGAVVGLAAFSSASPLFMLLSLVVVSLFQVIAWPAIESELMRDESHHRVQHLVGYFNLTWSMGTATAFLAATPLMNRFGLRSLFAVPMSLYAVNILLLRYTLGTRTLKQIALHAAPTPESQPSSFGFEVADNRDAEDQRSGVERVTRQCGESAIALTENELSEVGPPNHYVRDRYRKLAWLGNPLTYIAINVVVTFNPTIQSRLGITFAWASVYCSLWFYVRTAAFEILRRWNWWHYRWRFLCGGFGMMIASFIVVVLAPNLPIFLLGQVLFGLSTGLMYQSSLYYSMAGSDTQGEHGGYHEALIGLGQMTGPLIVFGGSKLFPGAPHIPLFLVATILALGLAKMMSLGRSIPRPMVYASGG